MTQDSQCRNFAEQWVGTLGARTLVYSRLYAVCWLEVCLSSLPPAHLGGMDFTGQGSSCQLSLVLTQLLHLASEQPVHLQSSSQNLGVAGVFVPWGCCKKAPKTGDFKQQKFILSKFWKLEVQSQGVRRALLFPVALGENPPLPLLASGICWQSLVFTGL